MIVAPRSRNAAPQATVLDFAPGNTYPGFPVANLWHSDARKPTRWRHVTNIRTGVNDRIDGDDGAPFVATLNQGFYVGMPAICAERARALNAVSSNWVCYQLQGSTNRYRVVLARTSGTASLLNATGPNVARCELTQTGGFRAEDRSAAGEHVGDVPATQGLSAQLALDFGEARGPFSGAIFYALDASPAAIVYVHAGATNPAADAFAVAREVDADGILLPFTSTTAYRYYLATIGDPRRQDKPYVGLGEFWMGTWFDTDRTGWARIEAEKDGFGYALEFRSIVTERRHGYPTFSEVRPGELYTAPFLSAPGVDPAEEPSYAALLRDLGRTGEAYVSAGTAGTGAGPDSAPLAAACRLCRLDGLPVIGQNQETGRYSVTFRWRVVA